MLPLQSKSGSINIGQAFIDDQSVGDDNKDALKIKQANSVDILCIFKDFGFKINDYIEKINCPLPYHKDRTASFKFYKENNGFYCFGCKSGGGPVALVSLMEDLTKIEAADKIIKRFNPNSVEDDKSSEDYIYSKKISLEFSTTIREFIFKNLDDDEALDYCEKITLPFDTITAKHNVNSDGLKSLVAKLKIKLDQYRC